MFCHPFSVVSCVRFQRSLVRQVQAFVRSFLLSRLRIYSPFFPAPTATEAATERTGSRTDFQAGDVTPSQPLFHMGVEGRIHTGIEKSYCYKTTILR